MLKKRDSKVLTQEIKLEGNKKLKIINVSTATKVKTQLPDMKNKKDQKNRLEYENAERAAVLMRRMEYSMGMTKKQKKVIVIEEDDDKEKKNSEDNEKEKKNYDISKVIRIQRWWLRKLFVIYKITYIQNAVRGYFYRKNFKECYNKLKSYSYNFSRLQFALSKIAWNIFYKKLRAYLEYCKSLDKLTFLQRKIRWYLNKKRLILFLEKIFNIFAKKQIRNKYLKLKHNSKDLKIQEILKKFLHKIDFKNQLLFQKKYFTKYRYIIEKIIRFNEGCGKLQKIFVKLANKKYGRMLLRHLKKFSEKNIKLYKLIQDYFNRKYLREAINNLNAIIHSILKRQKIACQRFEISRSKINLRYYFQFFKEQANKLKSKIEMRQRKIHKIINRNFYLQKKFISNKVFFHWKYINYFRKLYERNLFFSKTLENFCKKKNLEINSHYFFETLRNYVNSEEKKLAICKLQKILNKIDHNKNVVLLKKKLFQYYSNIKDLKLFDLKSKYLIKLLEKINESKILLKKHDYFYKWNVLMRNQKINNLTQAFFKLEYLFNYGFNKKFKYSKINILKNDFTKLNKFNILSVGGDFLKCIIKIKDWKKHNFNEEVINDDFIVFVKRDCWINKLIYNMRGYLNKEEDFQMKRELHLNEVTEQNLNLNTFYKENLNENFYLYDEKIDKFILMNNVLNKYDFDCFSLVFIPCLENYRQIFIGNQILNKYNRNFEVDNCNENKEFDNFYSSSLNNKLYCFIKILLNYQEKNKAQKLINLSKIQSKINQKNLKKYLKLWIRNKKKINKNLEKIKRIVNAYIKSKHNLNFNQLNDHFTKWKLFSQDRFENIKNSSNILKNKILSIYCLPLIEYAFYYKKRDNLLTEILKKSSISNRQGIVFTIYKWKIKVLELINNKNLHNLSLNKSITILENFNLKILRRAYVKWKEETKNKNKMDQRLILNLNDFYKRFHFQILIKNLKFVNKINKTFSNLIKKKETFAKKYFLYFPFEKWRKFTNYQNILELKMFKMINYIEPIFRIFRKKIFQYIFTIFNKRNDNISLNLFSILHNLASRQNENKKFFINKWRNYPKSKLYFEKILFLRIKILKRTNSKNYSMKKLKQVFILINKNNNLSYLIYYVKIWKEKINYVNLISFEKFIKKYLLLQINNKLYEKKIFLKYLNFSKKLEKIQIKKKFEYFKKAIECKNTRMFRNNLLFELIKKFDSKRKALKVSYVITFCNNIFMKIFSQRLIFLQRFFKNLFYNKRNLGVKFFLLKIMKIYEKKSTSIAKNAYKLLFDYCIKFKAFNKLKEFKRILQIFNQKRVLRNLKENLFMIDNSLKKLRRMFRIHYIRSIKNIILYINHYIRLMLLIENSSQYKKLGVFSYIKENIQNLKNLNMKNYSKENPLYNKNFANNINYMKDIFLKVSDKILIEDIGNLDKMKNLGNLNEKIFNEKIKFFTELERKNIVKKINDCNYNNENHQKFSCIKKNQTLLDCGENSDYFQKKKDNQQLKSIHFFEDDIYIDLNDGNNCILDKPKFEINIQNKSIDFNNNSIKINQNHKNINNEYNYKTPIKKDLPKNQEYSDLNNFKNNRIDCKKIPLNDESINFLSKEDTKKHNKTFINNTLTKNSFISENHCDNEIEFNPNLEEENSNGFFYHNMQEKSKLIKSEEIINPQLCNKIYIFKIYF